MEAEQLCSADRRALCLSHPGSIGISLSTANLNNQVPKMTAKARAHPAGFMAVPLHWCSSRQLGRAEPWSCPAKLASPASTQLTLAQQPDHHIWEIKPPALSTVTDTEYPTSREFLWEASCSASQSCCGTAASVPTTGTE